MAEQNNNQTQSNSSSGGFGNINGKDPLGRWDPMPDHHGRQFMEGKQTSAITPEGYPDEDTGGYPFIFVIKNKEDNTEERYPCMDEAGANQKKTLFEQRFNATMEQMWAGGDMPMPSIDEKYTLEIIQKPPVSQQQEESEEDTNQTNKVVENGSNINIDNINDVTQKSLSEINEASSKMMSNTLNEMSGTIPNIGNYSEQLQSFKIESPQEILAIKEAEMAQKVFKDNIMSLSDCIAIKEDLNMEDIAQQSFNEINDLSNKMMSSALNGMNGAIEKIGKYSEQITQQGLDQINKVVEEGLDYCNKQNAALQEAANKRVSQAKAFANNALNKEISSMAAASGLQKGLQMANEVNAKIQEQAAKIVNEKKKLIAAAKTKAEAALQKAKLAIMAMTGISL